MKRTTYTLLSFILALLFVSCGKYDYEDVPSQQGGVNSEKPIPEGYFEVQFAGDQTRTAVTGPDARISDLRYIVFKSTGEFVKEKRIVTPANGVQTWPLQVIKDTLPKGSYKAVFVGNAEKTLFPYSTSSNPTNYNDVLTGYKSGYASARIILPNTEFTNTNEYYLSNISFSNTVAPPTVLLQRIIGTTNIHRQLIDANIAINLLKNDINANIGYDTKILAYVTTNLPDLLRQKLDLGPVLNAATYGVIGGLDKLVDALAGELVDDVALALYNQLLDKLVIQLGIDLSKSGNFGGIVDANAILTTLLNPWSLSNATYAIVSIENMPKSIDFDRKVQDYFSGLQKFKYRINTGTNGKEILIKDFSGEINIKKINIASNGLIAGVIVDNLVDGPFLLNGTLIDINDELKANSQTNKRYRYIYDLVGLKLKSYVLSSNAEHQKGISIQLNTIANLDNIVKGIPLLGPLLGTITTVVLDPIKTITVSTTLGLPLMDLNNLLVINSWKPATQY